MHVAVDEKNYFEITITHCDTNHRIDWYIHPSICANEYRDYWCWSVTLSNRSHAL